MPDVTNTYQLALTLHRKGDLERARALYAEILQTQADHADTLHMLGAATVQAGDAKGGLELISRSLQINPHQPAAHSSLGNALRELNRPSDAIVSYDRALALDPEHAPALNNRGSALLDLGRPHEALESYERALRLRPNHLGALLNHGNALVQLERPGDALVSYARALLMRPDFAAAVRAQARVLLGLRRLDQALASLNRYLTLCPQDAEAYSDRGNVLQELHRLPEAILSYEEALQLDPNCADAHFNRGLAYVELGWHAAAAEDFTKVVEIEPAFPWALGSVFQSRSMLCDWTDWSRDAERIIATVRDAKPAIIPWVLFAISDCAADQLQCASTYARASFPSASVWSGHRRGNDRIRVAYVSADYRTHPVAQLLAGVLERHDRSRFEIIAVSLRPPDASGLGKRIQQAADEFVDCSGENDAAAAERMQQMRVDILVDLQGFTLGTRAGIFARRAAPIQVNFLGFPGTMGTSYIDYLIADPVVIPAGAEVGYAEHIVRLPNCYLPFDNQQPVSSRIPSRAEAGLPSGGLVFCAFNSYYKITPMIFDVWMRLLSRSPGSTLWLRAASPMAMQNLRREAAARGVSPERLVFAPEVEALEDHLARHRLADLFLDTAPYNAHASAANALWAGLPVLTSSGGSFAGRVGASLLTSVGLPELIAGDLQDYERLALQLAAMPERLVQLRARLDRNRNTCPLFDTGLFCSHLETAYSLMWQRAERGETPQGFAVPAQCDETVRPTRARGS